GLGAAIFTRTPEKAARMAPYLKSGLVAVNDVVVPTAHPATPFGGRGESGWGVTQGGEGVLEMTGAQGVSIRGGSFRPHCGAAVGKPPMSAEGFRGLLEWSHGASFGQRIGGLMRLFRGMRKKG